MAKLDPYIGFGGKCREAMEFYKTIFGGELFIQTVGESPMADQMPKQKDTVMHSALTTKNFRIMASDMTRDDIKQGNTVSLTLVCESKEEVETLFAKLAEGGVVGQPLEQAFFGTYGDLTDKFGIRWMLQFSEEEKK